MFFSALTRPYVPHADKEKARYAFRASGLDMSALCSYRHASADTFARW
jgi:hypothetical protein